MLQAPWDERLWSLLSTEPAKVTPQVIKENLNKRKSFRCRPEKPGSDDSRLLPMPASGEWRGEYQDMKSNDVHEVKFKISFLEDGRLQGSAISTDPDHALQDFKINGVFSLHTGIVAWCQFPSNARPNTQGDEFYGDVFLCPSGPARITGTFVTSSGRYCVVNLVHPRACKANEVAATSPKLAETLLPVPPKVAEALPSRPSSREELPTLLGGSMTPIKTHIVNNLREGRPSFFPKT